MSKHRPQSRITHLIVHCAATPNGRVFTAEDIDQWHGERNFKRNPDALTGAGPWSGMGRHASRLSHIGYHFVIRINGVVEVGRRLTETGAHARGHNHNSIGVCLIGTDRFTARQWAALKAHVESTQRHRRANHLPELAVIGHREVNSHKTCPGFDVQAWLAEGMAPMADHILEDGDGSA